jgi:hypothetical protein
MIIVCPNCDSNIELSIIKPTKELYFVNTKKEMVMSYNCPMCGWLVKRYHNVYGVD